MSIENLFGERLTSFRLGLGITNRLFAQLVGLSSGYISQLETGKRSPSRIVKVKMKSAWPERESQIEQLFAGVDFDLDSERSAGHISNIEKPKLPPQLLQAKMVEISLDDYADLIAAKSKIEGQYQECRDTKDQLIREVGFALREHRGKDTSHETKGHRTSQPIRSPAPP